MPSGGHTWATNQGNRSRATTTSGRNAKGFPLLWFYGKSAGFPILRALQRVGDGKDSGRHVVYSSLASKQSEPPATGGTVATQEANLLRGGNQYCGRTHVRNRSRTRVRTAGSTASWWAVPTLLWWAVPTLLRWNRCRCVHASAQRHECFHCTAVESAVGSKKGRVFADSVAITASISLRQ